jgi:hypothetical protein
MSEIKYFLNFTIEELEEIHEGLSWKISEGKESDITAPLSNKIWRLIATIKGVSLNE